MLVISATYLYENTGAIKKFRICLTPLVCYHGMFL